MKPLITVVIPVYNRAELVQATLQSLVDQTFRPFNVVLVDNNSSDETLHTLERWKESNSSDDMHVIVVEEQTPGASAARNAGLKAVETPWTMFFDSDDTMGSNHIEKVVQAINANPNADLIAWDIKVHLLNGKTSHRKFRSNKILYENLTHAVLSTQRYTARTELFLKAGGWNQNLKIAVDIELSTRLLMLNPRIVYLPDHYIEVFEQRESMTHGNSERALNFSASMEAIRKVLPEKYKHWADLSMINNAATWAARDPQSPVIVREILSRTGLRRRLLWKFFYFYGLHGGRGAAYLYRILSLNTLRL